MEDFSFKSLALTGMLVGIAFWAFGGSKSSEASREPDAVDRTTVVIKDNGKSKAYQPSIPSNGGRDEENVRVQTDDSVPVVDAAEGAIEQGSAGASSSEFVKTREEITASLTQGDVEGALDIAERKLEETIGSKDTDVAYIGYLHEFIMQNSEDDEVELSATVSALKGTQDINVRKFIYEKFQTYSPQLTEDLDRELNEVGIGIN